MTAAEVERLAREAGGSIVREAAARNWAGLMAFDTAELARFAALVQAAERERCARAVEQRASPDRPETYAALIAAAEVIRAG